jgi:hypothetical protein
MAAIKLDGVTRIFGNKTASAM